MFKKRNIESLSLAQCSDISRRLQTIHINTCAHTHTYMVETASKTKCFSLMLRVEKSPSYPFVYLLQLFQVYLPLTF